MVLIKDSWNKPTIIKERVQLTQISGNVGEIMQADNFLCDADKKYHKYTQYQQQNKTDKGFTDSFWNGCHQIS